MKPLIKDILNPEGNKWMSYLVARYNALEARRAEAYEAPFMKESFVVGGFNVHIMAMTGYGKIILWGGDARPHILLTDYVSAKAYDYYNDRLSKSTIAPLSITTKPLSPLFAARSQVGDYTEITLDKSWSSSIIGNNYDFLEGLNNYEMGVFHEGNNIYGRIGNSVGHIAAVPNTFLPDYAKPFGSLFGLPSYREVSTWNLYRGLDLHTISPASLTVLDSWHWIPSVFTAAPGNLEGLFTGFYYGSYPTSDYGFVTNEFGAFYETLTSLRVSFKGLLNTRFSGGKYQYGWAELVTEVDGEAVGDFNFFLQEEPLSHPGKETFANYRYSGITSNATITIGDDLKGANKTFQIKVTSADATADFWNFNAWNQQTGGVGIVMQDGGVTTAYRYSEYMTEVYSTETYHSHSISRDGTILAIFESDDGNLITRVQVFDLFGTREPTEESEYTSGGFTRIRTDGDVASVEALTGCIIPYREKDFEPGVVTYDLATVGPAEFPADDSLILPSLSIVQFNKIATEGGFIQKLTCNNGIDAVFSISPDECADNTYVLEDPDLGINQEKLVASFNFNVGAKGVVRGDFSGSPGNHSFKGVGEGPVVERPDTFIMSADESGVITVQPYSYIGELEAGECIDVQEDGAWHVDTNGCAAGCTGEIEFTASTSCGQTASGVFGIKVAPLIIGGPQDYYLGAVYGASGGKAPYSYETSSGSIDSDGEVTDEGSCTAAPGVEGVVTITVTDSCGQTASIEARMPYGHWEWDSDGDPNLGWCFGDSDTSRYFYLGGGATSRTIEWVCTYWFPFSGSCGPSPYKCCNFYSPFCNLCDYYTHVYDIGNDQIISMNCTNPWYFNLIKNHAIGTRIWVC